MDEQTCFITFENVSAAEANRYAEELRQALLDASPEVIVHRHRDDPRAQDFGATLVLLLGTPAVGAMVKAIGDWLVQRHRASLTIRRANEEIGVHNITSAKAEELASFLLSKQEPPVRNVPAPSPETTLLILLGASAWPLSPEFQSSEAFARAARRVKAYFLNARPFGLPAENLLDLFDTDRSADEQDVAISQFLEQRLAGMRTAGNPGRDLLLYFIGHGGFVGHDSDFYLALRRTRMDSPRASGMQMLSLADTLTERARHLRRILILDCCFAAAAFSAFQAGPDQVALQKTSDAFEVRQKAVGVPTRGTTLLCSSSHKSPSLLLPDASSTMFTKAIVDTLVQGTPAWQEQFSLRDVKDLATDVLSGIRDAPRPVVLSPDQSDGDVADLPFFPNPGFKEQQHRQAEEKSRHRAEEEQASLTEAEQPRRANEEHRPHTEERPMREAEPGREALHVSASPHAPTVAAAVLTARGGRGYLFALLMGVFASLFSVLLTSVLFDVDHANLVLLPLPPLALSLLTGVITGKRAVRHTAGLLAGLLVGISWFISLLSRFANGGITDPEWVTLVAGAATCGLFSWLVAWLTRGTTEVATRQPEEPGEPLRFALLVGACAGLFSVLFTGVIYSVVLTVNFFYDGRVSLMLLPPLILSLITGFLAGKRAVVPTVGLVAGLLVGVFWLVYVLSMLVINNFPPPAQYGSEEWAAVVACAAACGLLSWLVVWLTTRTHPDDLSSGSRNET